MLRMCVAVEDAAALLARGAAARRVGETAMNRESSRSHSVFTLTLETRTAGTAGLDKLLHARLNLVDLAGAPMLGFRVFCVHADAEDELLHARLNLVDLAGALILGFRIDSHLSRRYEEVQHVLLQVHRWPGQAGARAPQPGRPGRCAYPSI